MDTYICRIRVLPEVKNEGYKHADDYRTTNNNDIKTTPIPRSHQSHPRKTLDVASSSSYKATVCDTCGFLLPRKKKQRIEPTVLHNNNNNEETRRA